MVGLINELRQRTEQQETLKEDLAGRLDGTMKVLTGVRAGLEHVAEKLEARLAVAGYTLTLLGINSALLLTLTD